MSGFSAQWLALREPFDAAARSGSLAASLRDRLRRRSGGEALAVLDLGAGAGSNLRFLAPLLGGAQRWRLADHEPQLLAAAIEATTDWARAQGAAVQRTGAKLSVRADAFSCEVECEHVDLADVARVELPAGGLVTAAALLDLVSRDWLETLARRTHAAGAAFCFALTYDGRTTTDPREPDDAAVLALFNRHQLFDKGFGPALGMRAASVAEGAFEAHGYEVGVATSDWQIGRGDRALQLALLDGWLQAALEIAPESRVALTSWHERRRAHVLAERSSMSVGHVDLVGWL